MTYSEKLKDPRWQKKRLEIFERDKWTCQACGGTERTLNAHHLWYEGKEPWDAPLESLTTLCEECHQSETEFRNGTEKELLDALKQAGVLWESLNNLVVAFTGCSSDEIKCITEIIIDWRIKESKNV